MTTIHDVARHAGVSAATRHALVGRVGGSLVRDVGPLRTEIVDVPAGEAAALLKRYQAEPSVAHAEADCPRACFRLPSGRLETQEDATEAAQRAGHRGPGR